ncbi:MAG: CDP-alcohol phosphatidyltransferase family protein [Candidatus Aenigmatarchaeota archaeon]|nr:MAG: CDP-alcohol phosphatidyltransferase family protein [Candidatus Aenigmarchaeota archaeon]
MTLYKRREIFSSFSVKVGIVFSRIGLSPNQWTFLTIVPAIIALYFLVEKQFLVAAIFFIISAFIDLVDGSVARVMGKTSRLGAYLDTIMDRYVEGVIVFALLFSGLPGFYLPAYAWIFIYIFGSLMTTYAKSAAKEKELVYEELKGGLLERAERMVILFIGILLASIQPVYLTYVIVILAVLSNISALQRIWIATRE